MSGEKRCTDKEPVKYVKRTPGRRQRHLRKRRRRLRRRRIRFACISLGCIFLLVLLLFNLTKYVYGMLQLHNTKEVLSIITGSEMESYLAEIRNIASSYNNDGLYTLKVLGAETEGDIEITVEEVNEEQLQGYVEFTEESRIYYGDDSRHSSRFQSSDLLYRQGIKRQLFLDEYILSE